MKKHPVLFMIIILLLMAMACNFGRSDEDESDTSSSGDASSSGESSSSSESTDSPSAATAAAIELENQGSGDSAAEESAPDATPSLAPTPTEEPMEEPTEEPTATSDAGTGVSGSSSGSGGSGSDSSESGSSGSSSGGGAVSGGWGESGSGQQTACDHPYFPMRTGSTWTFNNGTDIMTWEITDVQGDLDSATAMMVSTIGDIVIEYQWNCSADEGIVSFDFATLGLPDLGTDATMENAVLDGSFMPAAREMVPGYSWNLVFQGTLDFSQAVGDQSIDATVDLTSDQTFTVLSDDPVSVGDQTYDGLQIQEDNTITMDMNVLGNVTTQEVSLNSLMQLAYGVGITHQEYNSAFGNETQDLVEFYIP
ncbi:MAG: hypothetical protein ACK2T3_12430 [Candidatus Promineifilaceae bacterium]